MKTKPGGHNSRKIDLSVSDFARKLQTSGNYLMHTFYAAP